MLLSCREGPSTRFRSVLLHAIFAASAWRSHTRLGAPAASARCTERCTKDSSRNSKCSASSPSTRTITSQSRRDPHSICEYFEYHAQPRPARARSTQCRWLSQSLPAGHRRERQHRLHAQARAQTPTRCSSCGRPRVSPVCAGCGSTAGSTDWTAGGIADGIGRAGRPSLPAALGKRLSSADGRLCAGNGRRGGQCADTCER